MAEGAGSSGARSAFAMVGPTLAALRKKAGLSSAALAGLARVGKSQLSKYEQGKELPKLESLARILDALDTEPLTFFYLVHAFSGSLTAERLHAELLLLQSSRRVGGLRLAETLLDLFRNLLLCLDREPEARG